MLASAKWDCRCEQKKDRIGVNVSKSNTSKIVLKMTGSVLQVFINIIVYTILILLIVRAGGQAYTFTYRLFGSVRMDTIGMNVTLQVTENDSEMNVASKLELNKVIPDKYSFYFKTKLAKAELQPGEFVVNTSMDYDEILAVLTADIPESN